MPDEPSADQQAPSGTEQARRSDDVVRRAALIATAVALPVVIVLAVLVNVLGRSADDSSSDDGAVASISAPTSSAARADDLPAVQVDTPAVTKAADLACPTLMEQLPLELVDEPSRLVQSDSAYAYAWGDPAVVLICGVDPPAGFTSDSSAIQIDDVQWFVDDSDPDTVVWTTVDRTVPVQVRVPATTDSASVTALGPIISGAIPYTTPTPSGG